MNDFKLDLSTIKYFSKNCAIQLHRNNSTFRNQVWARIAIPISGVLNAATAAFSHLTRGLSRLIECVLTWNKTNLKIVVKDAFSMMIQPIALIILGISSFISPNYAQKTATSWIKDYHHDFSQKYLTGQSSNVPTRIMTIVNGNLFVPYIAVHHFRNSMEQGLQLNPKQAVRPLIFSILTPIILPLASLIECYKNSRVVDVFANLANKKISKSNTIF